MRTLQILQSVFFIMLSLSSQIVIPVPWERGPLYGMTIVIDPGHGGADVGAVGPRGTQEKDVTLAISLYLEEILRQKGARVYLTRRTDQALGRTDLRELTARVLMANRIRPHLFVSIHTDGHPDPRIGGSTTYYGHPHSKEVAQAVQKRLVETLGTRDMGARQANFFVIRATRSPSILVETAFITNPQEEIFLANPEYQREVARAIAQGIGDSR